MSAGTERPDPGAGVIEAMGVFSGGRRKGSLRGRHEVNSDLAARLGVADFDVAAYLIDGADGAGLEPLLGVIEPSPRGGRRVFVEPSALSMLAWSRVAFNLATALSFAAHSDPQRRNPVGISEPALAILVSLAREKGERPEDEALLSAWRLFLGFSAPEEEYRRTRVVLRSREWRELSPRAFVRESVVALILNPYFLLVT